MRPAAPNPPSLRGFGLHASIITLVARILGLIDGSRHVATLKKAVSPAIALSRAGDATCKAPVLPVIRSSSSRTSH
jgi:hypothetical protein